MLQRLKNDINKKKYISLEITPNHGISSEIIIEKLDNTKLCKKISSFVVTDSPLARLKSNSVISAYKLQEYYKKPVIATITMRDRNKIALQSELLGANELNICSILALTGDGVGASDQPKVKGVFESNSLLLLEMIKCFNAGIDYSSKPLNPPTKEIASFVVCNAKAMHKRTLIRKLSSKLKFNPLGVITQPIYSEKNAHLLKDILQEAKESIEKECQSELILGFFPVTRFRTAQFLNSHVPGIHIPETWSEKLEKAKRVSDKEELKVGTELSRDLLKKLLEIHPKIHLMGANNFKLLDELLE